MQQIVFFDGVCTLCNQFVDWLMAHDSRAVFKVASLQGETAKRLLPEEHLKNLNSIVYFENGVILTRSTAVLKIASHLDAPWCYAKVFLIIPRFIRDAAYCLIAKYRYLIFGKRETCRLPTPEEKSRFLD